MPPIRVGASSDAARKVIDFDSEIEEYIKNSEEYVYKTFYSSDPYLDMQQHAYDKMASLWSINKRDFVVGSFDRQNAWKDYDLSL